MGQGLQAIHQIVDGAVLGRDGLVAHQLPSHHLGSEVGQLKTKRCQNGVTTAAGMGGDRDRTPVEQTAEIFTLDG